MISILIHIPNRHDATNFYRGTGPLSALRKKFPQFNISINFASEISFATAQMHDLAFFQRPSTSSELEAIRIFRRLDIPVIVDFDDLLLDVPTDNPAHKMYMNKETQQNIISIIKEASCVWVSTKELKRCIQIPNYSLNEKVYVVPNAIDDVHTAFGARVKPQERKQPAVLWRGSPTHERDVMEYAQEIVECADGYPKQSFIFAGWNPWFITDRMRRSQAILSGALPVGEFMDFVYATGAHIGIVPLHSSRFNRCKSNIAWLEMSWGGAACLVPDWEEWRNPGCISYSTQKDFKAGLASMLEMSPAQLNELNKMSWEHITKNYLLTKVNPIRMNTILACLADDGWPDGWQRISDPDEVMELE